MGPRRGCLPGHMAYVRTSSFAVKCLSVHTQVIMPNTACDGANATRLYKLIGDQFPTSNLVTVQRRYFNETKGELCTAVVNDHICTPPCLKWA